MGNIKGSPRYRVDTKTFENASPPPAEVVKYVVFDRRAGVELGAYFERYEDAENECASLNELSPGLI